MNSRRFRQYSVPFVSALALALSACNGGNDGNGYTDSLTEPPRSSVEPGPIATATPGPIATSVPNDPAPDYASLYTGDAQFLKYFVKFIDDAKREGLDVMPSLIKGPKLKIKVASLADRGSSVIGLCSRSSSKREVTFSPSFWNNQNETQRELVFHHELGHCVLGRAHRTSKLSDGTYSSLMYPSIMSSAKYNAKYAYYVNELFTYNVKLTGVSVAGETADSVGTEDVCGSDEPAPGQE